MKSTQLSVVSLCFGRPLGGDHWLLGFSSDPHIYTEGAEWAKLGGNHSLECLYYQGKRPFGTMVCKRPFGSSLV